MSRHTTLNTEHTLDIGGLETVYDQLATAIDSVGAEKSELFLVKLALLAAESLNDIERFDALIESAVQDL